MKILNIEEPIKYVEGQKGSQYFFLKINDDKGENFFGGETVKQRTREHST